MIVVTGGAGFIGSALVAFLNQQGITDIVVVDALGVADPLDPFAKWKNLLGKEFLDFIPKDSFIERLPSLKRLNLEAIVHLGAYSYTTERDGDLLIRENFEYSKSIANFCFEYGIRLVYASSAATYGDGAQGFSDVHETLTSLRPTNLYGFSKHLFDRWLMELGEFKAAGLKFFNVYGPNEYHKKGQSSPILPFFQQATNEGIIKLFKSGRAEVADGAQSRDFVYVKDCCEVIWWLLNNPRVNGIFNVGSGQARTWLDCAYAVFSSLQKSPQVEFIDFPAHLAAHYQYYTCADISKLRAQGFKIPFTSLEEGVSEYVNKYLLKDCARW